MSINSDNAVSMQLTDTRYQRASRLHMVLLPEYQGVEHTKPSIMIPHGTTDEVRIIMNKTGRRDYTMTGPKDENFPLLIDRDPKAFLQVQEQVRRLDDVYLNTQETSINPEPAVKRAKIDNRVGISQAGSKE